MTETERVNWNKFQFTAIDFVTYVDRSFDLKVEIFSDLREM